MLYSILYYDTKKSPPVSFTVTLVKQLAKALSEKMSSGKPFKLRNRISIFHVFRQIISEKRSTYIKPAINISKTIKLNNIKYVGIHQATLNCSLLQRKHQLITKQQDN